MRRLIGLLLLLATVSAATPQPALAQPSPTLSLPVVQPTGGVTYVGSWVVPALDGASVPPPPWDTTHQLDFTQTGAMGKGPGTTAFFSCHDWHARVARVNVPTTFTGQTTTIAAPCETVPNLSQVAPSNTNKLVVGGAFYWNGRTLITGYPYYAASAAASHFTVTGASIPSLTGPYVVSGPNIIPGMVAGSMAEIPAEWRTLLGGPALTGLCCIAIISRSSYGPSVAVFDPDQVGVVNPTPATLVVGYPDNHQTVGTYLGLTPYFSASDRIAGIAFPAGTRSVLFFGRHSSRYCYGPGTSNQALDGQPDGQGNVWCWDPTDSGKGPHGYPYVFQVWAYDANDFVDVKNGVKQPWELLPYAVWNPGGPIDNPGATVVGGYYDPVTQLMHISTGGRTIYVYQITGSAAPPPPPPETTTDLQITQSNTPDPFIAGTTLSYTATVTNVGPAAVTAAPVTSTVPSPLSGFTWSCTSTSGSCGSGTGNISTTVTLGVSGTATITASGVVPGGTTGTITRTIAVAAPSGITDTNTANNSVSTINPTGGPTADLRATLTNGATTIPAGAVTTYVAAFTNLGPSASPGAVVAVGPSGLLTSVSWTCAATGSAVCPAGSGSGAVSQTIATFPNAGTVTYTLVGTAPVGTPGTVTTTAGVTAPSGVPDPTPSNNSVSDADAITATSAEICGNGIDDDLDGQTDEGCVEVCGDGIDNDGDALIDEGCPVEDTYTISLQSSVISCRAYISATPPPGGGWKVQFLWQRATGGADASFGAPRSSAPYTRERTFTAGQYILKGTWTKSGQTSVPVTPKAYSCP